MKPWLLFLPGFHPLNRPNFFQVPLSLLVRGLLPRSLIGGVTGGVMGLSLVGEPLLPESSVRPGPEIMLSEPLLVALIAVVREQGGWELVGLSLVENRCFANAVVSAEGADLRFGIEGGAEYEPSNDPTPNPCPCGGGLLREE